MSYRSGGRDYDRGGGYERREYDRGGGGSYHSDRGREYDRGGGGYDRDRDRSRSRDYGDRRGGYDDRGRHGGGYRGGGGRFVGRGRGRGGGRGPPMGPRPSQIKVRTNYFHLEVSPELGEGEWVQYHVEIKDAMVERDADGNRTGKIIQLKKKNKDGIERQMDITESNPISRRILDTLRRDHGLVFASDGAATAYAPCRLFNESDMPENTIEDEGKEDHKSDTPSEGIYGPADPGKKPVKPAQIMRGSIYKMYPVKVKNGCDKDDEDADRVKNQNFLVKLTEVATIPETHIRDFVQNKLTEINHLEKVRQAMDIIQKSALLTVGMQTFGKSPRAFYFSQDKQMDLLDSKLKGMMKDANRSYQPIVGIKQAIKFCENGNIFVNTDSVVDFANREFEFSGYNGGNQKRMPLVNERNNSIAGIPVGDLLRPVHPDRRGAVEEAIKKLTFHIKYKRTPDPSFVERMKSKGKSEKEIDRMSVSVFRNKRMLRDQKFGNTGIIWAADDPELHSFELKPRGSAEDAPVVKHTVASYYREKYRLNLRYPKLPIVYVGKDGWFPVEFLLQAYDKMKGSNLPDQVKGVLGYYDEYSGTRSVDNIKRLSQIACSQSDRYGMSFEQVLKQFNLRRSSEPIELEARVLPEPRLSFENTSASLKNGSWDLRDKKFMSPSDVNGFAVVDLAASRRPSAEDYVNTLFKIMEKHNMTLPSSTDYSHAIRNVIISVHGSGPESIFDCFNRAVKKSKDYFLYDKSAVYKQNHVWFKTRARSPDGKLSDCLIIPGPSNLRGEVALILRTDEYPVSHIITHPSDNTKHQARIMVKIQESKALVDPFDFRYVPRRGYHEAKLDGKWVPAKFDKFVFAIIGDNNLPILDNGIIRCVPFDVPKDAQESLIVAEKDVECPSIVFVYLPDNKADTYNVVKMISHFHHGVQSSCAVAQKFSSQRNPDQYCSNIALKVNAKLANSANLGRAWGTAGGSNNDITWVNEVPTMVVGISISNGYGQDSISVICGSVCLDRGCMQFAQDVKIQTKTELVDKSTLIDLVKTLAYHYELFNGVSPQRVLIYRDGVSEGTFDRAKMHEIQAIRTALYEYQLEQRGEATSCPKECNSGCAFCCPPITYVVCMTQHTVRLVPSSAQDGFKNNVFSGTCLDHTIMDFKNKLALNEEEKVATDDSQHLKLFSERDSDGYDFLLTAQGGLKGTSKPIFYRVILNENVVWAPKDCGGSPLTKAKLEELTYHMSYQYSTATKAVRKVPVIYYSSRLSEMVMGYVNYLRGKRGTAEEGIAKLDLEEVEESEKKYLPKRRDGTFAERVKYIRKELENFSDLPSHVRTELLPSFSPFEIKEVNGKKTVHLRHPFRPHLSA
eukprot:CAMPEP_0184858258 /NCGR_PEP_ID=MMETSP0580-20130426/3389_1 /TAXON_ID=1118495 /ORGANISM="Dactyliosolen fragilissimus" /LENGTH=1354 /DNA_ID=CAMNT_0027354333 /DNA_START=16 /DNA_END=4080 /DNA_ORIENTATION=+